MGSNRGNTSLKCKRRNEKPMLEFDRLLRELRVWIAGADLQWRAKSVRKGFDKALSQTGSHEKAFEELSRSQRRLISKDATKVWGKEHPDASGAIET